MTGKTNESGELGPPGLPNGTVPIGVDGVAT